MTNKKATAPTLDWPIEIAYSELDFDEEETADEKQRVEAWKGISFTTPCGSAYEHYNYVELHPKVAPRDPHGYEYIDDKYDWDEILDEDDDDFLVDIETLRTAHPYLAVTDFHLLPEAVRKDIEEVLDEPTGAKALRLASCSLMVFTEESCPTKWVGVVGFRGRVQSDAHQINIRVGHGFTAVNPAYRRQSFAPVISGMSGWIVSDNVKNTIEDHFRCYNDDQEPFTPPKQVTVDVIASHEIARLPHLFRSFANGVNFLLSAFECEWDWRYKEGKTYSPPPPKYAFRLFRAA